MADNVAHVYRDLARKIVAQLKRNLIDTIESGESPDLYWKVEHAIIEAMRFADQCGSDRTREQMEAILVDFEEDDGTPQS